MIRIYRFTNGQLAMFNSTEKIDIPANLTIKDSYIVTDRTKIGYIKSAHMKMAEIMFAVDDGINHIMTPHGHRFKIEDIVLDAGDYFTIDIGGRCTTYTKAE